MFNSNKSAPCISNSETFVKSDIMYKPPNYCFEILVPILVPTPSVQLVK